MTKKDLLLTMVFLLIVQTVWAQQFRSLLEPDPGRKIAQCPVCGMEVFSGMLTRVDLITEKDTLHVCGLDCAAILLEKEKIKQALVVDFPTRTFTDLYQAHYVIKSNILPVRGRLPILAFREKQVAEDFTRVHHGTVLNAQQILQLVKQIQPEISTGK